MEAQLSQPNNGCVVEKRTKPRLPCPWPEILLDMNTKDLNQFIKAKNLTPEVINDIKLCRRRKKNRHYATTSRIRKEIKKKEQTLGSMSTELRGLFSAPTTDPDSEEEELVIDDRPRPPAHPSLPDPPC